MFIADFKKIKTETGEIKPPKSNIQNEDIYFKTLFLFLLFCLITYVCLFSNNVTGRCYEAKEVGTVNDEQLETRSSQSMAHKVRANSQSTLMTSDFKSQLSRARPVTVPCVSMKDKVQKEVQNTSQDAVTECKKSVAVRGRRIPKKVPATPDVTPSRQSFLSFTRKSPRPSGNDSRSNT